MPSQSYRVAMPWSRLWLVYSKPIVFCLVPGHVPLRDRLTRSIPGLDLNTVGSEISFRPNDCFSFLGPHCRGTSPGNHLTNSNKRRRFSVVTGIYDAEFPTQNKRKSFSLLWSFVGRLTLGGPSVVAALNLPTAPTTLNGP
jgi:hypothetical protein